MNIQTGLGLVWLDFALALLAAIAAGIQYWRISVWRASWMMQTGRWLAAIGWTTLSVRIFERLWDAGDIFISLPSLISLVLISSGSIIVALVWQPGVEGPR